MPHGDYDPNPALALRALIRNTRNRGAAGSTGLIGPAGAAGHRLSGEESAVIDSLGLSVLNTGTSAPGADVAELADALASGASDRKVVEVRVLSSASS